jgi:hypothetical protein
VTWTPHHPSRHSRPGRWIMTPRCVQQSPPPFPPQHTRTSLSHTHSLSLSHTHTLSLAEIGLRTCVGLLACACSCTNLWFVWEERGICTTRLFVPFLSCPLPPSDACWLTVLYNLHPFISSARNSGTTTTLQGTMRLTQASPPSPHSVRRRACSNVFSKYCSR